MASHFIRSTLERSTNAALMPQGEEAEKVASVNLCPPSRDMSLVSQSSVTGVQQIKCK